MSAVSWAGDPYPNYPNASISLTTQTIDGTSNVIWVGPNTNTPIPSYPSIPVTQTTSSPLLFPDQSCKEITERLCEITASPKVYLRKAVSTIGGKSVGVNIEINNIQPPPSDFSPWDKALVLFNSIYSEENLSLRETNNLMDIFAAILTASGSCVIIDGKEFDPQ